LSTWVGCYLARICNQIGLGGEATANHCPDLVFTGRPEPSAVNLDRFARTTCNGKDFTFAAATNPRA
jgi:hypothetical protein